MSTEEPNPTILDIWGTTPQELTDLIRTNPSLGGMIFGYLAEVKLRHALSLDKRITSMRKDDDHDRTKKGDLVLQYKGQEFIIESKSLQSNTIKRFDGGICSAKYQCDGSDKRTIKLPSGEDFTTTCLLFGEFDVVAVPLWGFHHRWEFAYALNSDLDCSRFRKYPEEVRCKLIASLQDISLPLKPPYTTDLFSLLDAIIVQRVINAVKGV